MECKEAEMRSRKALKEERVVCTSVSGSAMSCNACDAAEKFVDKNGAGIPDVGRARRGGERESCVEVAMVGRKVHAK